jgi:hypothetical protein
MVKIGDNILVTTDAWFLAPDGESYRAVWGKLNQVSNSEDVLKIRTNNKSTNWYIVIGNMLVAGCQIHYLIKCDSVNLKPIKREIEYNGELKFERNNTTRIYNANEKH